jgi:serine protease
LKRAVEADVIVLAAAGNCVEFVVWPARYEDCIAVAGTSAADQPWQGSCRGPDVAISAPGQNVYRATISLEAPAPASARGRAPASRLR